ncbi:hypothetical protein ACFLTN_01340 [Chloroflexota bacterium]
MARPAQREKNRPPNGARRGQVRTPHRRLYPISTCLPWGNTPGNQTYNSTVIDSNEFAGGKTGGPPNPDCSGPFFCKPYLFSSGNVAD